jgi:lauroyl/myristoyl acyltransferase
LPDGHIKLAVKTGAPLVIGFSRRNPDHTYSASFLPPYHPPDHGTGEDQVQAGLNHVIGQLEAAISEVPEQWTVTVSVWADEQQRSVVIDTQL